MRGAEELFGDDPKLSAAYEYWVACKGDDPLPKASRIDPIEIPNLLFPNVVLAEYLEEPGHVKFRIVGNEMADRWGSNFTGKTSRDIFSGSYREFVEDAFEQCRVQRVPIYSESAFRWDQGGIAKTRRVMTPFADDALETVTRCLVVQVWPGGPAQFNRVYSEFVATNPPTVINTEPSAITST